MGDPDGRWSASYSLYSGIGWGFSFGFNPLNGKYFGKVHLGVGAEGGWNFDPNDNGDSQSQECGNGLKLFAGTEADWGINVGSYGIGATSATDFGSGRTGNLDDLLKIGPKFNAVSDNYEFGGGAHVSFTFSFVY